MEGDEHDDDDDERTDPILAADAPASPSASLTEEEALARGARERSYALATELRAAADGRDEVAALDLKRWATLAAEVNDGILRYARLATQRTSRLNVEVALMQQAMFSDVLDREATHVHTLQTIARLEKTNGDASQNSLSRAMRLVAQLHSGTAALTSDLPLTYFGADACMRAIENACDQGPPASGHEAAPPPAGSA